MDPMLELARHPDILEAIGRIEHGRAIRAFDEPRDKQNGEQTDEQGEPALRKQDLIKAARDLLVMRQLATDYPNVWMTEVVHAFYKTPDVAATAWVELRYCRQFLNDLAKQLRQRADAMAIPWIGKKPSYSTQVEVAKLRKTHQQDSADDWSKALSEDHDLVDRLCIELDTLPAVPTFIRDLIADQLPSFGARDSRTRDLLAHPDKLRRCVPEYGAELDFEGFRRERQPLPFSFVHEGELLQIGKSREARGEKTRDHCDKPDRPESFRWHAALRALNMNLCGLAFSGGGIRSATFNLGVLQALAENGLLRRFDYLSSVSGGGYIGSWLAGWIRRETDDLHAQASSDEPMAAIARHLSPTRSPNPLDESVRPIRFLREYSNYLTPRAGFLSADTWTMIGIYVRNALLNQVTIVGLLVAVLLLPRGLHATCVWFQSHPSFLIVPALFWILGVGVLAANLRRLDPPAAPEVVEDGQPTSLSVARSPRWYARPLVIHLLVAIPWLIATAFSVPWLFTQAVAFRMALAGAVVGVSLLVVLTIGGAYRCWISRVTQRTEFTRALPVVVGSAAVAGFVAAGLVWVVSELLVNIPAESLTAREEAYHWHLAALVTPAMLSVVSLAIVAMLGMLGARFPDEHREWWSRFRTMLHVYALAWLAWFGAAVYAPWAGHAVHNSSIAIPSSLSAFIVWVGSTVFGITRGPKADAKRKEQRESSTPPKLSTSALHYVALAAPYVFAIGLVLAVSIAIHAVLTRTVPGCAELRANPVVWKTAYWQCAGTEEAYAWLWALISFGIAVLFSWRVNINEFSIHHFYKNRLVRCYLGASRGRDRKPDWFTGFDPKDDIPLSAFDAKEPNRPRYPGPYPIVNCALNLVGGRDLAWQERKATSFVFTPKYCGYDVDRAMLSKDPSLSSEGFVPTKEFYSGGGPAIGTAMAISGAAANPSMGRSSSPALTFLMTVFNVRLGWWIGNPRNQTSRLRQWLGRPPKSTSHLPGPRLGLLYTILELFGATDDSRGFVNLSDGGHFDNLGVYELVRRCCRYIVVCDAGQDGRFLFEDLGDVIRRCRTDFGVEIEIAVDRIRERDALTRSQTHCVIGRIHYLNLPRRVDDRLVDANNRPLVENGGLRAGATPAHEVGYIVYIKPTMTGDEPQDVLEYLRRVPEFPHQTTADQWFGESQFESYRKLGMHIADVTFARYVHEAAGTADMQPFFEHLYHYWYPPSLVISEGATEHAKEYLASWKPCERRRVSRLWIRSSSGSYQHPKEPRLHRATSSMCATV